MIEATDDSRCDVAGYIEAREGDTTLISVPMSHSTGLIYAVGGLLAGHLIVMPRFDPAEFLRLVTEHRVTLLATVPTIMHRLLPVYHANPDAYDLSSIREFTHIGAPCPPTVKKAWIDLSARRCSGSCTAAANFRRSPPSAAASGWRIADRSAGLLSAR